MSIFLIYTEEMLSTEKDRADARLRWAKYMADPEFVKRRRAYDRERETHHRRRFIQARMRARKENVPFEITQEHCKEPPNSRCGMCFKSFGGEVKASIDRVVPSLGYVESNIGWLCLQCNGWKYQRSLQQLDALALAGDVRAQQAAAYVRRHQEWWADRPDFISQRPEISGHSR